MDATGARTYRDRLGSRLAKLGELSQRGGVRAMGVAITVLVVLSFASWTMVTFDATRPSPLPDVGAPMPTDMPTDSHVSSSQILEEYLDAVANLLTREVSGGRVAVVATHEAPILFSALACLGAAQQGRGEDEAERLLQTYWRAHDLDRYHVFSLALESTSLDLTSYRPESDIRLRSAAGYEVPPETWIEDATPMPDRYRVGMLHFPRLSASGQPLLAEDDDWVELRLWAPDGQEHTLRWELPFGRESAAWR